LEKIIMGTIRIGLSSNDYVTLTNAHYTRTDDIDNLGMTFAIEDTDAALSALTMAKNHVDEWERDANPKSVPGAHQLAEGMRRDIYQIMTRIEDARDEAHGIPRMTSAELQCMREYLGFTATTLSTHLGVAFDTLRSWEAGKRRIPHGIRREIEHLEELTAQAIAEAVTQLIDAPYPISLVYRSDAHYHQAHPEMDTWPAAWHRRIIARAAQEVPGLGINYAP
jgi:DNA-binding transcriptional regulator YiaG